MPDNTKTSPAPPKAGAGIQGQGSAQGSAGGSFSAGGGIKTGGALSGGFTLGGGGQAGGGVEGTGNSTVNGAGDSNISFNTNSALRAQARAQARADAAASAQAKGGMGITGIGSINFSLFGNGGASGGGGSTAVASGYAQFLKDLKATMKGNPQLLAQVAAAVGVQAGANGQFDINAVMDKLKNDPALCGKIQTQFGGQVKVGAGGFLATVGRAMSAAGGELQAGGGFYASAEVNGKVNGFSKQDTDAQGGAGGNLNMQGGAGGNLNMQGGAGGNLNIQNNAQTDASDDLKAKAQAEGYILVKADGSGNATGTTSGTGTTSASGTVGNGTPAPAPGAGQTPADPNAPAPAGQTPADPNAPAPGAGQTPPAQGANLQQLIQALQNEQNNNMPSSVKGKYMEEADYMKQNPDSRGPILKAVVEAGTWVNSQAYAYVIPWLQQHPNSKDTLNAISRAAPLLRLGTAEQAANQAQANMEQELSGGTGDGSDARIKDIEPDFDRWLHGDVDDDDINDIEEGLRGY